MEITTNLQNHPAIYTPRFHTCFPVMLQYFRDSRSPAHSHRRRAQEPKIRRKRYLCCIFYTINFYITYVDLLYLCYILCIHMLHNM